MNIDDLMSSDVYELKVVESFKGYVEARTPGKAYKYTGFYGEGYRVFIQSRPDKISVMYFIKKEN